MSLTKKPTLWFWTQLATLLPKREKTLKQEKKTQTQKWEDRRMKYPWLPSEPTGGFYLILGKKGAGKSTLLIEKLLKGALKGVFDQVWIVSPTAKLQPVFQELDPAGIKLYNSELTPEVLALLVAEKRKNVALHVCIILDDCGRLKASQELAQLCFLSRHLNCSCVILTQKITSCPTEIRSQVDCFISFASTSHRERQALYHEVGRGTFREFSLEFEKATYRQYGTFVVSIQQGRPVYFDNCF
jgi:energy-coupling factor transporter ATP-binding protein EcfA2